MKAIPLSQQVYGFIKSAIHSGTYQEMLPSESELAGHHGVSRTVIRGALDRLRKEGIIQTVNGKGSVIVRQSDQLMSLGLVVPEDGIEYWGELLSAFKQYFAGERWSIKLYPYNAWRDVLDCENVLRVVYRENAAAFVNAPLITSASFIETVTAIHNSGFPVLYFGLPYPNPAVDIIDVPYDANIALADTLAEREDTGRIGFALMGTLDGGSVFQAMRQAIAAWDTARYRGRVDAEVIVYAPTASGIDHLITQVEARSIDTLCLLEGNPPETLLQRFPRKLTFYNMAIPGIPRIDVNQRDLARMAALGLREIICTGVGCRRLWVDYHIRALNTAVEGTTALSKILSLAPPTV